MAPDRSTPSRDEAAVHRLPGRKTLPVRELRAPEHAGRVPDHPQAGERRFRVWYDEGIEPGNEWPEEVGRALTACQLFVVFMSPEAMESRNVRNEINMAAAENKAIMVVFLQPTELSEGMKLQIGTVQFLNRWELGEAEFHAKLEAVLDPSLRAAPTDPPRALPRRARRGILAAMKTMLPIARSDIHAHLTQEHVEVLFGKGHRLTKWRDLTIPGAYACHETVEVRGPAGSIKGAVVVGPCRSYTQVEVSFTNAAVLGITPPLRESGDLEGSPARCSSARQASCRSRRASSRHSVTST